MAARGGITDPIGGVAIGRQGGARRRIARLLGRNRDETQPRAMPFGTKFDAYPHTASHDGGRMFDYVLVPFDGGPELRAAFAPAADLAWRCNAKMVIISTTAATDDESRLLVKSLAISQSGADVDFWVDLEHSIGDALVEAAAHRPNSLICVASRHKQSGMVRRRNAVIPIPRQVFTESSVPVMALGPETVVSGGLPMTEVVMVHDGSDRCAGTLATVSAWASGLRLAVQLVSLLPPNAGDDERDWLIERLEAVLAELAPTVPAASLEILEARDPIDTMVAFLSEHRESFFVVGPDADGSETANPGSFAAGLLRVTPQALLFPARRAAQTAVDLGGD